jgi:hypothetical protein
VLREYSRSIVEQAGMEVNRAAAKLELFAIAEVMARYPSENSMAMAESFSFENCRVNRRAMQILEEGVRH